VRPDADVVSIVAGLVLVALGGVLLADATGVVSLSLEALAPIACGAVGAILVAVGLTRDQH
jgi:hypothetical protein